MEPSRLVSIDRNQKTKINHFFSELTWYFRGLIFPKNSELHREVGDTFERTFYTFTSRALILLLLLFRNKKTIDDWPDVKKKKTMKISSFYFLSPHRLYHSEYRVYKRVLYRVCTLQYDTTWQIKNQFTHLIITSEITA